MSRTKRSKPGSGKLPSKRKREDDELAPARTRGQIQAKAQKQGQQNPQSQPDADADVERRTKKQRPEQTKFETSVATSTPTDLSDKFTAAIKKYHGEKLSTIELEDLSLPDSCFKDTTSFEESRVVASLSGFLEQYAGGGGDELRACAKENGSPHTLIFTSSAIRATDLLRAVRVFGNAESKVAKLFAKHMKLKEMVRYVRTTRFGIGAGTAGRVLDLVRSTGGGGVVKERDEKEDDETRDAEEIGPALKLDKLKRVVIDASYVDEKARTVFDDRETFLRILELLNLEEVKGPLVRGDVELLVF